jgi:hypothetical protein
LKRLLAIAAILLLASPSHAEFTGNYVTDWSLTSPSSSTLVSHIDDAMREVKRAVVNDVPTPILHPTIYGSSYNQRVTGGSTGKTVYDLIAGLNGAQGTIMLVGDRTATRDYKFDLSAAYDIPANVTFIVMEGARITGGTGAYDLNIKGAFWAGRYEILGSGNTRLDFQDARVSETCSEWWADDNITTAAITGSSGKRLTNKDAYKNTTASTSSLTIDATYPVHNITLTATVTSVTLRGATVAGQLLTLRIYQSTANAYTITGWPATLKFTDGYQVNPSTGAVDTLQFVYDGSNWWQVGVTGRNVTYGSVEFKCTSNCTIAATQQGHDVIITNRDSSGNIDMVLPLAKKGMRLAIYNVGGNNIVVYRQSSDTFYYIVDDKSATGYTLAARGSAMFCYAPWDGYWQCGQ